MLTTQPRNAIHLLGMFVLDRVIIMSLYGHPKYSVTESGKESQKHFINWLKNVCSFCAMPCLPASDRYQRNMLSLYYLWNLLLFFARYVHQASRALYSLRPVPFVCIGTAALNIVLLPLVACLLICITSVECRAQPAMRQFVSLRCASAGAYAGAGGLGTPPCRGRTGKLGCRWYRALFVLHVYSISQSSLSVNYGSVVHVLCAFFLFLLLQPSITALAEAIQPLAALLQHAHTDDATLTHALVCCAANLCPTGTANNIFCCLCLCSFCFCTQCFFVLLLTGDALQLRMPPFTARHNTWISFLA